MTDNTKDTAGTDQQGVEITDLDHEMTLDEMSYKAGGLSADKWSPSVIKIKDAADIQTAIPDIAPNLKI